MLLYAHQLVKDYADRRVVFLEELSVYSGDRIGIVGDNGAGKTTLLGLLSGELTPDEGAVYHYTDVAYVRQFGEGDGRADTANPRLLGEFAAQDLRGREGLSGGERTRLRLADAFAQDARLVFADEPTCNLDMEGIALVVEKLARAEALLLVCHDRAVLDRLCNRILEVKDGRVLAFEGNYSAWAREKERERRRAQEAYEHYTEEKRRLEQVYQDKLRLAKDVRKKPKDKGSVIQKDGAGARSKGSQQKNLQRGAVAVQKRIEQMETAEKPVETPRMRVDFGRTNPPQNRFVIRVEDLCFGYEGTALYEGANLLVERGQRLALSGPNGSGKTTLLNLIAGGHPAIYTVPQARFGFLRQQFEHLDPKKTVYENALTDNIQQIPVARSVLAQLLFDAGTLGKPASVLSGGEKIRLSLAKLLLSDANVLLLDEPTNYLDMASMRVMEEMLSEYEGTLVFVSHDRHFVNRVATQVAVLEGRQIALHPGNLEDYERERESRARGEAEQLIIQMRRLREAQASPLRVSGEE